MLKPCPDERRALPRILLKGLAEGHNGFLKVCGPPFPLPEPCQRDTQVVLCLGPRKRNTFTRLLTEGLAESIDGLLKARSVGFPLTEFRKRMAQIIHSGG